MTERPGNWARIWGGVMIRVIGIGPGSKDYLTPLAAEFIEQANILVGGKRLIEGFAREGQEVYYITNNLPEVVEYIRARAKTQEVAVLASGDPGMYGVLNFLMKHFSRDEIEVIPGISSMQLACARLKISWHDAVLTSVHGRELGNLAELVRDNEKVIILTDYKLTPALLARELIKAGIGTRTVWVCQNLSYPNEVICKYGLGKLASSEDYPGSIMVILKNL